MTDKKIQMNTVIYQAKNGAIELKADAGKETIWASQQEIAELFGVQRAAISKHIKNIYATDELKEKVTVSKMETVQKEGKRQVARSIDMYNLDMIIAVGYRVNSKNATQFRIWATEILRDYVTQGFVVNRQHIQRNYTQFMKTVESIQGLLSDHVALDPVAILELIKEFSQTWLSLDAYDRGDLTVVGTTKKSIQLSGQELSEAIENLRSELIEKGEATDIFAQERKRESVSGIVGNVMQSFDGKDVYPTAEEKAVQLLYFMVKNHPFVDGNKRSGAFAFIWFLRKVKVKGFKNINPGALTALTLLIAESKPEQKEQIVALITQILK